MREALPAAEALDDPKLLFGIRNFEMLALARLGQSNDAQAAFEATEALAKSSPELRPVRSWALALIEAGLGHPAEAEAAFRASRDGFLADRNAFNAALVTLDWTLFLLDHGRPEEARLLAAAMGPVFQALGVVRETLASWILLRAAVCRA